MKKLAPGFMRATIQKSPPQKGFFTPRRWVNAVRRFQYLFFLSQSRKTNGSWKSQRPLVQTPKLLAPIFTRWHKGPAYYSNAQCPEALHSFTQIPFSKLCCSCLLLEITSTWLPIPFTNTTGAFFHLIVEVFCHSRFLVEMEVSLNSRFLTTVVPGMRWSRTDPCSLFQTVDSGDVKRTARL